RFLRLADDSVPQKNPLKAPLRAAITCLEIVGCVTHGSKKRIRKSSQTLRCLRNNHPNSLINAGDRIRTRVHLEVTRSGRSLKENEPEFPEGELESRTRRAARRKLAQTASRETRPKRTASSEENHR